MREGTGIKNKSEDLLIAFKIESVAFGNKSEDKKPNI
jgi:hypothetical protein